ncbi:MAG: glycosyltransferase [Candidatus Eisenbacteria bacterium]|nr:glycosyltransferase [Candidatus Eisenbacteria bacterium]
MKIAFVVESFPNKDEMSGGVKVSVRRQAESLNREHDVVVFAARTIFPRLARYSKMKEAQGRGGDFRGSEGGMRIYRPPCVHVPLLWKALGPLQLAFWIVIVYSTFERRISLIHAHRCFPVGFAAALAAFLLRRPVVLTTHGSDVNFGLKRDAVGLWISLASKYALRHASIVIAVSNALAGKIVSAGTERNRIRVIPNGAEASLVKSMDKQEARRKLGLPADVRIILLASNLVPVKDPLTMVRAFAILSETVKDVILVILGRGELEETLRREIGLLPASNSVLLKGRRPHEEMPLWLAACDIVALSSLDEGSPLMAVEGFISGKPFVGTAVGGVPEIVSDESLGLLVEPANPSSLAGGLKEALGRKWDKEKLARHGLKYSWENLSKQISQVYAEVCGCVCARTSQEGSSA